MLWWPSIIPLTIPWSFIKKQTANTDSCLLPDAHVYHFLWSICMLAIIQFHIQFHNPSCNSITRNKELPQTSTTLLLISGKPKRIVRAWWMGICWWILLQYSLVQWTLASQQRVMFYSEIFIYLIVLGIPLSVSSDFVHFSQLQWNLP